MTDAEKLDLLLRRIREMWRGREMIGAAMTGPREHIAILGRPTMR
jgi:hypothetical protein